MAIDYRDRSSGAGGMGNTPMGYGYATPGAAYRQPAQPGGASMFTNGGAIGAANTLAGRTDPMQELLRRFIMSMMGPLDPNDPAVQQLTNQTMNAAGRMAYDRGIGGPLSVNAGQSSVANALNNAQMQRYGMGLQAYGTMQGNQQLDLARQRMAYDMWRQQQQEKAAQGGGIGQTIGSLAGGGLGLAAGLAIPGAQPFLPALVSGGAQLGGGVGGQIGAGASGYGSGYPGANSYGY